MRIILIVLLAWPFFAAPAKAAPKCTRLVKTVGGEQLVNTCNSCRIVNIQRKRPGSAAPINRTLTVAPKTTTTLSFRGPGQSRILADTACRPKAGKTKPADGPKADGKRCIIMQRTIKGGVSGLALANTCGECRTAVISRIDAQGQRRMQNVAIAARSQIPLPPQGAVQAGISSEKSCK